MNLTVDGDGSHRSELESPCRTSRIPRSVVGIITAFCCIATVNTLVAVTRQRHTDNRLLAIIGAAPTQITRAAAIETTIAAVTATALGLIAAAATAIPYACVRTGSPAPSGTWWIAVTVAAAGALTTASVIPVVNRQRTATAAPGTV
ncbi:FtsX-like permease family protein [Catenulispora pinisilvae]|uniref:FtsX-like permease family protein n=1 Tax=Catenulispora pinisilvae TaxID=2705253 RepID=UPI0018923AEE|nr:FtsX-like permease family protein [Catenulispora pinisilvae]